MSQLRNRMVTDQDGKQHVSSLILSLDEAAEMLDTEADMHAMTGWTVTRYGQTVRCQKGDVVRWVWIRSRPPLKDTL